MSKKATPPRKRWFHVSFAIRVDLNKHDPPSLWDWPTVLDVLPEDLDALKVKDLSKRAESM